MHHLLVTIGSHGDTHPFVGLGTRLRDRGHRVTLVANGTFEPLARSAGLEFEELGTAEEYRRALDLPDMWHPLRGFKNVFEVGVLPLMRKTYDIVERYWLPGETIVTSHAIAFGARLAQEKLGVPLATVHLAPAVFRSGIEPPTFAHTGFMRYTPAAFNRWLFRSLVDRLVADPVLAGPLNAFRAELGLPPVRHIIDEWWNSPQLVIGLFPDWFARPQPEWPKQLRLTGFPLYDERGVQKLSPQLESFLAADDTPIAFTFGSAMTHARDQLAASAEACRRLGRRGLLVTKHHAQLPPALPAGVIHVDYAPFSELLPRCAALVHHGGVGTTAQALAAGIPQLIVPFAHDQHDNAARVKRLGCGEELRPKAYRPAKVAKVLGRLLSDPRTPARCKQIAAKFDEHDPLADACELIENLAPSPAPAVT